jgi:hypothetical protein
MVKRMFQRKIIRIAMVLLACFVLIQFIRPSLGNPPVTADLQAPAEVKSILQRACYDCHSNETKLAWFDKPAPAYWLVAAHVKEGRALLNFSHWDSLTTDQQKAKLFESLNQMVFKEMPLSQYSTFHGDARITDDDIKVLRKYLASLAPPKLADSAAIRAADGQFVKWTKGDGKSSDVKPELNGLPFMSGYKDWSPISSTERWDNGTMRVIMGNPIAVKAVKEGHTNPWPDGAAFAKVDWKQLLLPTGEIEPGEFIQVEIMVKDKDKYADTEGWGWGRWKGTQLKPYGKDASFVTECMHCHQPMKDHDFVFTTPVARDVLVTRTPGGRIDGKDTLPFNPLDLKVITSRIDKSKGTMSILYGDEHALHGYRMGLGLPPHSMVVLVTWAQKEDEHWYGANIAKNLQSVDVLTTGTDPEGLGFKHFEGQPAREMLEQVNYGDELKYLSGFKASVMP